MPLFSDHHTNDGSIEYSAVDDHVTYDANDNQGDTQPSAHTIHTRQASLYISDRNRASADESNAVDQRVLKIEGSPGGEVSGSQNVPIIAGWPCEP